jgi:hypothetical protein
MFGLTVQPRRDMIGEEPGQEHSRAFAQDYYTARHADFPGQKSASFRPRGIR